MAHLAGLRPVLTAWTLASVILAVATAIPSCSDSPQRATPTMPSNSMPSRLRAGNWRSQYEANAQEQIPMRVRLTPESGRVGQALTYRGSLIVWQSEQVRFDPPKSDGPFTWSMVRAGRERSNWLRSIAGGRDSVWIEAQLQVFEVGRHSVPGPAVRLVSPRMGSSPGNVRLPAVMVTILPTVTPADSTAGLRALHGPVGAPWWERLPWTAIVAGLALLAAAVALVRRMRKRKPAPVRRPVVAPAPARARIDPAAEALRALATLRGQSLPAAGRFQEHAFELTAILRRFLEATAITPRPGDTSDELVEHLRASRMPEEDIERVKGLLTTWDRVKFARAPLTEREAERCEQAVEAHVRRVASARLEAARATGPAAPRPASPAATRPTPPPEAA